MARERGGGDRGDACRIRFRLRSTFWRLLAGWWWDGGLGEVGEEV